MAVKRYRPGDQLDLASPAQQAMVRANPSVIASGMKGTAKPLPVNVFARLCEKKGVPRPDKEHAFHPTRNWRLDVVWIKHKVALEVHGAVHQNGRHNRGAGFLKDREKMNEAQLMGWIVLEVARSEGSEESWCCLDVVNLVARAIKRQSLRADHPPVDV